MARASGPARRESRASVRLCYSDRSFNPRTDCCPEIRMNHCLRKAMNPILLAAIVLAMALSLSTPAAAQQSERRYLIEQVGPVALVQFYVDGFDRLTPEQRLLAY